MIDLTSYARTLNNRPVAVYGLGRSGLACVRALCAAGISVAAWDDHAGQRQQAADAGATIDPMEDLAGFAALVLSPGIPLHFPTPHPVVLRARAAGVEVIGDIELLHRAGHGLKTVGITGTNGKSTTTALLGHVLNRCGIGAVIGGNIGTPVMALDLSGAQVIVLELSSYQIDLCPDFTPDVAVLLNLTPDHIDRHGSMGGYIAAKERLFAGAGAAIICTDDVDSAALADRVQGRTLHRVSFNDAPAQAPASTLRGEHNRQNIAAVTMAAHLCGAGKADILSALADFPGLPHRMYPVRTIGEVAYINDSKATNADAAGKALACFDSIYWIVGGKAKEGGLNGLEPLMGRVAHAFTIGAAAESFAAWLEHNKVPFTPCGTIDRAVGAAHAMAQKAGEKSVVLLSPACASFDQFTSFEHRGDVFTALVRELDGERARA